MGTYEDYGRNGIGVVIGYITDKTTNKSYQLRGHYKIAGYTPEDNTLLISKDDKATFSYESKNGITAYFIRNWSYGNYTIYFMLDNILFEMEVAASDKSVTVARQIIDSLICQ